MKDYSNFMPVDWVDEGKQNLTRQHFPYSYDAHYKWRDFDKNAQPEGLTVVYSDRMQSWDYDKYAKATKNLGWIEDISKTQAKAVINSDYEGKYQCVGYAICCNVSNGYGIGMFFVLPTKQVKREDG